jgi:hypothetical protein
MKTYREHEKPGIKEYEDNLTGKATSRLHTKSPRALKKKLILDGRDHLFIHLLLVRLSPDLVFWITVYDRDMSLFLLRSS